jgi:hypothetical protein
MPMAARQGIDRTGNVSLQQGLLRSSKSGYRARAACQHQQFAAASPGGARTALSEKTDANFAQSEYLMRGSVTAYSMSTMKLAITTANVLSKASSCHKPRGSSEWIGIVPYTCTANISTNSPQQKDGSDSALSVATRRTLSNYPLQDATKQPAVRAALNQTPGLRRRAANNAL